jgi:hypothetical protein
MFLSFEDGLGLTIGGRNIANDHFPQSAVDQSEGLSADSPQFVFDLVPTYLKYPEGGCTNF